MNEQEQINRLMAIIKDFTNEIRAHSAPECDDEENPFAPILKRADEAISEFNK